MQYKYAYFGNSEGEMLDFVDKHWDRVVSFGHSQTMEGETFEIPGWYVRYSKNAVVSESAKVSKKTDKKVS